MSELIELTAVEAAAKLRSGEVSSRQLTEAALARIDAVEPRIKAFLTVTPEGALAQADAADARRAADANVPPLCGVPIALKDNLCVTGVRTTAASKILDKFIAPYDATVVTRLRDAGAVFVGKTNLDEFAMGSSTENSGFYPTHNPWRTDCVPGGSSGGSAAAVAALEAPLALGSDTGGSIRQPAAFCGVVGLKPTYGRVSRYGLIAYASSLDQIGPFGRTVADCALLMNVIAGHDELDSTSTKVEVPDYTAACEGGVKGLRIGIPKEFYGAGVTPDVAASLRAAVDQYVAMGAVAEECSLPSIEYCLAAYYIIAPAEASSNLARFDGVRYGHRTDTITGHVGQMEKTRDEGFGSEVKQRIMIGTYALSAGYYDAYYKRAQQVRTLIRRDFDAAFEKYDLLLTPTSPCVAFRLGEMADPLAMKLADVCTLPVNMAGIPAISLPCGFGDGLPIGMQLIGKAYDESMLFRAAAAYEAATTAHTLRAPV